MSLFASATWPLIALTCLLAACQNSAPAAPPATANNTFAQARLSLENGQLQRADNQLSKLRNKASDDPRLSNYQRDLASAYLQASQRALQNGNLDRATHALGRARVLTPNAPALTRSRNGSFKPVPQAPSNNAQQPSPEPAGEALRPT